jgi:hypothetical protein
MCKDSASRKHFLVYQIGSFTHVLRMANQFEDRNDELSMDPVEFDDEELEQIRYISTLTPFTCELTLFLTAAMKILRR